MAGEETIKIDSMLGPKMVFCHNCGKQHSSEANFCVVCGAKLFRPLVNGQCTQSPPKVDQSSTPVTNGHVSREANKTVMENPFDRVAVIEAVVLSTIGLGIALIMLSGVLTSWLAVLLFLAVAIALMIIFQQLFLRPKAVEIGHSLVLHWRHKGAEAVPLDAIANMNIESRTTRSWLTRWTGCAMGIRGRTARYGLSYEIATAIQEAYIARFGVPPTKFDVRIGLVGRTARLAEGYGEKHHSGSVAGEVSDTVAVQTGARAEQTVFDNPINRYWFRLSCIVPVAWVAMGIVPALLMSHGFIVTVVMTAFAVLYFWGVLRKHIYTRPVLVTVRDDGLVLKFRGGKERFIQWTEIKDVYSKPGPKETKSGRGIGEGAIRVHGQRTIYLITYEIALALTGRHTMAMGHPPVKWDGQAS